MGKMHHEIGLRGSRRLYFIYFLLNFMSTFLKKRLLIQYFQLNRIQPTSSLVTASPVSQAPASSSLAPSPVMASPVTASPVSQALVSTLEPLRLHPFNDIQNFPPPEFHGCNDNDLCEYSNVCFSSIDGLLVFDTQDQKDFSQTLWSTLDWLHEPRRPKFISKEIFTQLKNVHFADRMFVLNCHRVVDQPNPAHLMFGLGDLFAASSGIYGPNLTGLDLILHHQCMNVSSWGWGKGVEDLIYDDAVSQGLFRGNALSHNLYLPWIGILEHELEPNDMVVCGKTVYHEPKSLTFLGGDPLKISGRWRHVVEKNILAKNVESATTLVPDSYSSVTACAKDLKIAIWKRTEGSALRHLINEEEIKSLVAEYSDHPLSTLSMTSTTSMADQAAVFRSFDILITTSGAQLTNMIFNTGNAVFIQINAVWADDHFENNAPYFLKGLIQSYGHLPYNNPTLQEILLNCSAAEYRGGRWREAPSSCGFHDPEIARKFLQADFVVNTTVLREDLNEAATIICVERVVGEK